jgi:hypothetical protein
MHGLDCADWIAILAFYRVDVKKCILPLKKTSLYDIGGLIIQFFVIKCNFPAYLLSKAFPPNQNNMEGL